MRLRRVRYRTAEERRDDDTVELTPCEAGLDRCSDLSTTLCDCCGLWICERHEHDPVAEPRS